MDDPSLAGMTVNERLYHLGLFDAFDAAARSRDLTALIQVLVRAQFSEEQAAVTAKAVATNPRHFGY